MLFEPFTSVEIFFQIFQPAALSNFDICTVGTFLTKKLFLNHSYQARSETSAGERIQTSQFYTPEVIFLLGLVLGLDPDQIFRNPDPPHCRKPWTKYNRLG